MKKIIIVLVVALVSLSQGWSQGQGRAGLSYGLGGSFDVLNPINTGAYLTGMSFFAEFPRSASVVPYGKIGYYLPTKVEDPAGATLIAIDDMTNPYQSSAKLETKISTFSLEGGTRYYLGNDYDIGLAGVLETKIRVLVSPVSSVVGDYDETKYRLETNLADKYTSISLFAGFGAGIKYSQPWGTLFTMAGLDLYIISNAVTPVTSLMLFSVQVGYRRDLY